MKLFEPNQIFLNWIRQTKMRYNDPKFIFNGDLFSLSRNSKYTHDVRVGHVNHYLNEFSFTNSKSMAEEIVTLFENLEISKFNQLNVNTYLKKVCVNQ